MDSDFSYLSLLSYGDTGWGDEFLRGAIMTIKVAVSAYAIGIVLGLTGAGAKLSGGRVAYFIADVYTTIVRSVPELLLILLIFYSGPAGLRALLELVGLGSELDVDAFLAAVAALGFIVGAYTTEVFRGAILAVPKGQIEAARAIGMGRMLRFRRVLAPQMLRYALPGLGNLWLNTTKDASLVSVVSLGELMNAGKQAAGSTKMYFFFYMVVGLSYLVITVLSMIGIGQLERLTSRGVRRA